MLKRTVNGLKTVPNKVALAIVLAGITIGAMAGKAEARNYYVSSRAPLGVNDGTDWSHAWTKLSKIDWTAIQPGDVITVDGGSNGISYTEGLVIQKSGTASQPIIINTSAESGRSGAVTLVGWVGVGATMDAGLSFGNNSYVRVEGRPQGSSNGEPRSSFRVFRFKKHGAFIGAGSYDARLTNVELDISGEGLNGLGCPGGSGLRIEGSNSRCTRVNVNTRVDVALASPNSRPIFAQCWFHGPANTDYVTDEAVRVFNSCPQGPTRLIFDSCIFGPYMESSVVLDQQNTEVAMSNCLFINPRLNNLEKTGSGSKWFHIRNCTSYLHLMNHHQQGHATLQFVTLPGDSIQKSIFYGANVNLTGSAFDSQQNTQFKTFGNTMMLSPTQTDPRFVSQVISIPYNAPYQTLKTLDFTLQPNSPALGKGSNLTSVKQLSYGLSEPIETVFPYVP